MNRHPVWLAGEWDRMDQAIECLLQAACRMVGTDRLLMRVLGVGCVMIGVLPGHGVSGPVQGHARHHPGPSPLFRPVLLVQLVRRVLRHPINAHLAAMTYLPFTTAKICIDTILDWYERTSHTPGHPPPKVTESTPPAQTSEPRMEWPIPLAPRSHSPDARSAPLGCGSSATGLSASGSFRGPWSAFVVPGVGPGPRRPSLLRARTRLCLAFAPRAAPGGP